MFGVGLSGIELFRFEGLFGILSLMKTKFVRIVTKDKLILSGNLYSPDKTTKKTILHIHGMSGNFYENLFLDYMAYEFTKNGYSFFSVNNRGAGTFFDFPIKGKKEAHKRIGNAYEKFEECIFDIKAGIDFLEKEGFKEIILQGHSLGAVKVAYYMAKTKDKRVSKLILVSPSDMVGLTEDKDHTKRMSLSKRLITEGKGSELLPDLLWGWARLSAATYVNLSERNTAVDVFNTYDKEAPSCIKDITIPILAILGGTDDAAILPIKEALEVIKNKAKKAPRFGKLIIGKAPHSYFGYEKSLAKGIVDWLKR